MNQPRPGPLKVTDRSPLSSVGELAPKIPTLEVQRVSVGAHTARNTSLSVGHPHRVQVSAHANGDVACDPVLHAEDVGQRPVVRFGPQGLAACSVNQFPSRVLSLLLGN